MPKVSVIMTVYNTAPYLRQAMDSILNQTFIDFEFIIVDDGSTDSSAEIIKSYTDSRIVFMDNEKNLGIVMSTNKGLEIAKGEYIARMDSDDISTPNRFKIQHDFLQEHKDVFLVAGSFNYINSTGDVMSSYVSKMDSKQVIATFPNSNPIHQPTVMWRNVGNIYYREKAILAADRDLWLRLSQEGKKFQVLSDILLLYRVHSSSVSISKKKLQEVFIDKVNEWYYERERTGKDSYDSFDADLFTKRFRISAENGNSVSEAKELKFFFKENNDMQSFRQKYIKFRKEFGFLVWPAGHVFFVLSFSPLFLLKIIRTRVWVTQ